MKMFIISLLLSTLSFAANAVSSECAGLRASTNKSCLIAVAECDNLGACAHRRNTCPASVETQEGCEGINQCTSDTDALLKTSPDDIIWWKFRGTCSYHWSSFGSCRLYNRKEEYATFPTCPGRRIPGKRNDDVNFDCEAHRALVTKNQAECNDAREVYVNQCSKEQGYKTVASEIRSCDYKDVNVLIGNP